MNRQEFSELSRYTRFLLRNRRWILALATALALVAGFRTVKTYAALKSDLEELLPVSAPSVQALSTLRQRLHGIRHLGVVVAVDRPEAQPEAFRFLDALAARVRTYPKEMVASVRVDAQAERAFAETYALQLMDPADVRRLREAVEKRRDWDVSRGMGIDLEDEADAPKPEVPIAELREKYEARFGKAPSAPGSRFVSPDGKTAVLLIQTGGHETGQRADAALLDRVQKDIAALGFPAAFGGGLRVGYAGDVASRVEEARGLESDLTLSSAVVLLLVAGSVVWFYRSARALPILGVPLAYGTVAAFGLVALPPLSILYLNSNTAFLGSIVIGNGINSGIILLARVLEERRAGAALPAAIDRALSTTWKATLAASAAAAASYGSLVFTAFRGFNQFGWIGGVGLMTCWAANYTLIPLFAYWLGGSLGAEQRNRAHVSASGGLTRFVIEHPRAVALATAALAVIATIGVVKRSGDWIEYDLSTLRRRDSWQTGERYWGKRMDAAFGRYLTPTVILAESTEETKVIEARVRELMQADKAGGLIGSVRSSALFLSPEREQSREEARRLKAVLTPRLLAQLPDKDRALVERALSPRALEPLRAEDVPPSLLTGLLERSGRFDRNVLVFPKLTGGTWNAELLDGYASDLRTAATVDGRAHPVAGSLLLSNDIAAAMNADGPHATRLSLLAVLGICWLAFRARGRHGLARYGFSRESLGYSGAAMGSLLLGVLLMMGVLAWTGERVNFSNFVALPITFGIAADYSINVLRRYQAEPGSSLLRALGSTTGAVALCSATTVIGFGSLLMAQNRALFSFGVFAIAGELTCLATAVLALPALLTLWENRTPLHSAGRPVEVS
ncbi:MAG TPA: MMPL family transporter [Polyangiaceae bacterium]|nr:MMPL family transporter [Polyangiaceae bacterium]